MLGAARRTAIVLALVAVAVFYSQEFLYTLVGAPAARGAERDRADTRARSTDKDEDSWDRAEEVAEEGSESSGGGGEAEEQDWLTLVDTSEQLEAGEVEDHAGWQQLAGNVDHTPQSGGDQLGRAETAAEERGQESLRGRGELVPLLRDKLNLQNVYPFEAECLKNVRTYKGEYVQAQAAAVQEAVRSALSGGVGLPGGPTGAAEGRGARSVEVYIPEVEGLLTTNVCYHKGRFFRSQGAPGAGRGGAELKQGRPFDQQFGSKPSFETTSVRSARVFAEVEIPVERKRTTLSLTAACPSGEARRKGFKPSRFLKRLPMEPVPPGALWLGREAVTLLGIERVASNIGHWSRDMVFFHRAGKLLRFPGNGTRANYLLAAGGPAEGRCSYMRDMLRVATRGLKNLSGQTVMRNSRPVCMRAVLQRVKNYPGDAATHHSFAAAAWDHCGVTSGEPRPPQITLIVRKQTRAFRNLKATVAFFVDFAKKHGFALKVADLGQIADRVAVHATCKERGACPAFCAQAALMARTDILVGMHGAALSNAVLLPPGAALVEIMNCSIVSGADRYVANGHFGELAEAHNLHYLGFRACSFVGSAERCACQYVSLHNEECSVILDLQKLERALELVVALQQQAAPALRAAPAPTAAAARGPGAASHTPPLLAHVLTRRRLEKWLSPSSPTDWNRDSNILKQAGEQFYGKFAHNEKSFCADDSSIAKFLRTTSAVRYARKPSHDCCKVIFDQDVEIQLVRNTTRQLETFDDDLQSIYSQNPKVQPAKETLAPCE